mgnify:CR=1 FL=1
MSVVINGKRYVYYRVPPPVKAKLEGLIKHKNWEYVFDILKRLGEKDTGYGLFETKE